MDEHDSNAQRRADALRDLSESYAGAWLEWTASGEEDLWDEASSDGLSL